MPFSQGHALVIGVGTNQYHPELSVPITVADATSIQAVLQDPNTCGYLGPQVKLIHDDQTTRAGILQALDELSHVPKGDTIFLFYCGHGALGTDGKYYLVSHDARVANGRVVQGTGVREDELLDKLRAVPSERMLLIFNACHSGNISPTLDVQTGGFASLNPPEDSSAALLGTGQGRIIITACREDEKSYIGGGNLTIFSQAVVNALQGRGVQSNGSFISAFGLYESVYENVTETVQNSMGQTQTPELTVIKGAGPFAVALYKGATSLGTFDGQEALPANTSTREVTAEKADKRLNQILTTNQSGGVNIGGSAHVTVGGNIVGGDSYNIGSIKGGTGIAIGRNAGANSSQGIQGQDLNALFQNIYHQIDARPADPNADKDEIKGTVEKVQAEVAKAEQANPGRVERWLKELREIAPDILQVTAAALLNPVAGAAAALRAIAERMK